MNMEYKIPTIQFN